MEEFLFEIRQPDLNSWKPIPHVDEAQMREVDRIAVEDFKLGILQMMENAGRNLATLAWRYLEAHHKKEMRKKVLVLAGVGGNGGGGLCAARHLHNRGIEVRVVLTKTAREYGGAAEVQLVILDRAGVSPSSIEDTPDLIVDTDLVLDALIGYSLRGAPCGAAKRLIDLANESSLPVISLDLPSGLNATTGDTPGSCVRATQTMSLALPKPGLINPVCGELFLADIGIPPEVYHPLGLTFAPFFGSEYLLAMRSKALKLQ